MQFGHIENCVTAHFEIITPLFLGGADQQAEHIRPASFKGMLRFWWRAVNWGRLRKESADDATALRKLHEQEAQLFGAAAAEEKGGQGCFLMSIPTLDKALSVSKKGAVHPDFSRNDAARYLGYGLMEAFSSTNKNTKAGQLNRDCINEKQAFVVKFLFKKGLDDGIKNALIAFGLLGGMGSRTRHGMGSVALKEIRLKETVIWSAPKTINEYQAMLKALFTDADAIETAPYSAFNANTRLDILMKADSTFSVLNQFGKAMLMYRSWGKNGKVLNEEREGRFKDDHDWSKGMMEKHFHPRRVIFGLPHNYGKKPNEQVNAVEHERRASPLFFHVHSIKEEYIGVSLLMNADFLPAGEKINAGGNKVDAKIEWDVLTDFLDGETKSTNIPRFPNKQRIWGK